MTISKTVQRFPHSFQNNFHQESKRQVGEMVQQLRASTPYSEDPCLVPLNSHVGSLPVTLVSGDPTLSTDTGIHIMHGHNIQAPRYTHKIFENILKTNK